MKRIDRMFAECRAQQRRALIVFVSVGDPSLKFTRKLVPALIDSGADLVEFGVPFSDPMADGPTIQAASERALKSGVNLPQIMDLIGNLRVDFPRTPFVLFSYYNLILQYGVERLAADSAERGVDGWLVVDLPPEEDQEVRPALARHGLAKIPLLAPNTPPERWPLILEQAQGFVYYITVTGVTGARTKLPADLARQLSRIRTGSPVPVAAGFGVSTAQQARTVGEHADGVIVGSRLINVMQEAGTQKKAMAAACRLVRELAAALR